ncbi:MAG: NitT/TauT family transport system substrate-binding protein [Candidatus Binatota bacterium]|nr:NitT/TauT family transport system substrate-binding protein [Candidatus Binatota bacterium]
MKILCIGLFAAVFALNFDCYADAQDKIRVGLSSVSALHGAMWVAEQKGLFRKHGIETEIIVTGQGATAGIGALLANDIQIASAGGDALINAALRGGETVMIAAGINKGLNRIMVRSDIKTPADLKGKKLGATRVGAVSHSVLLMMLKRWNMSPTDVQVLQLGSSPNMLQALDKGGIDGAVMTIPFVFIAEERGFRVLVDLAETDIYYLHTMIASTRSYIKANRDSALRFLKGFLEGIAYFKHNKKESLDIVRKKLRVSADQERNLERSYDLLATKYYEATPYPSLRGVETVLGIVEKDNPKAKTADPKSFVDDSLLREIEQSGFVKTLYKN